MPSSIAKQLREAKKLKSYNDLPFMLIGQEGVPFTVLGFSRDSYFSSPYFTLLSFSEEGHFAVLEILASSSCGNELFHTQAKIHVDLNYFCGIQIIAKPIFDCLQVSHITKDQFCLPFTLTKNEAPKTISRINRSEVQHTGTIAVHYTGVDPYVVVVLYTNEKLISLTIPKNEFRSITVFNLQSIEIDTPIEAVKGTIDIQLNFSEKSIIYF